MEAVGATDDFFELGGHSLLATQLTSRLRTALGVEVPLRAVFESPTVRALASFIDAHTGTPAAGAPLRRHARVAEIPLSFAQQRLWFIDRLEPGVAAYNIPNALLLEGALDVENVDLQHLVNRSEWKTRVTGHAAFNWTFGHPTAVGAGPPMNVSA